MVSMCWHRSIHQQLQCARHTVHTRNSHIDRSWFGKQVTGLFDIFWYSKIWTRKSQSANPTSGWNYVKLVTGGIPPQLASLPMARLRRPRIAATWWRVHCMIFLSGLVVLLQVLYEWCFHVVILLFEWLMFAALFLYLFIHLVVCGL